MNKTKKKIAAFLLLAVMTLSLLTGCAIHKCDFCGKTKICDTTEILGKTIYMCDDCKSQITGIFGK